MKVQTQVFMTVLDELILSEQLKESFPAISFIDDNIWPTTTPILKDSISDCVTQYCFLWDKQIVPKLPVIQLKNGQFQGPTVGPVIQLIRSRKSDHCLIAGRMAQGIEKKYPNFQLLANFCRELWKILRRSGSSDIVAVDPRSRHILPVNIASNYLVFQNAIEWCKQDSSNFLKHANSDAFYLPASIL